MVIATGNGKVYYGSKEDLEKLNAAISANDMGTVRTYSINMEYRMLNRR